jgi:hypothetical protein
VALVVGVNVAAATALATLPFTGLRESVSTALFIIALAALTASRPVLLPSLKVEMTSTHPLLLIALAVLGPMTAAAVGLVGVIAAAIGKRRYPVPMRLAFNLGAVVLAASAASWTFLALGGRPGDDVAALLWPLVGATIVFYIANTGLVSTAVALEKEQPLFSTWQVSFGWAAASYFAGLTVAAILLLIVQSIGPWGLILVIPPCWLILAFYREHKKRLDEKQHRVDEVEALNTELDQTVHELQSALAQVKKLQGLIPICMHCKSIRNDTDTWQRLEEYIAEHSDATFTHTLCNQCKDKHYHEVLEKVR